MSNTLTKEYSFLSNQIVTTVTIYNHLNRAEKRTDAIWDTGATNTSITKSLAQKLQLVPIGLANVKGVHGEKQLVNVYPVMILLNNDIRFTLQVTECDALNDGNTVELLIGMDIIGKGDFAVTNFNGKTVMTYRHPSVEKIDFSV